MHVNTFSLRLLAPALNAQLVGTEVAACFSQEKDELVIGFAHLTEKREVWLRAVLTGSPTALGFPEAFRRARQNSVDLFPEMLGLTVTDVVPHFGERSFHLLFSDASVLIFKLHGARANVIWLPPPGAAQTPILFRRRMTDDTTLNPSALAAPRAEAVLPSLPVPVSAGALPKYYGDVPTHWLREQGFDQAPPMEQHRLWDDLNHRLLQPEHFFLIELAGKLRLSLLPLGLIVDTFTDPMRAAEEFLRRYRSTTAFSDLYARAHRYLTRRQEAAFHATNEVTRRLKQLATDASFSQTADIIMANLTQIPPGATEVELYDFYNDAPRRIKLKSGLTPQRVAENLYRKSKNQQLETRLLRERLTRHETDALRLMEQLPALEALAAGADFRQLRQWLKDQHLLDEINQSKAEAALPATPFKEFESHGFRILVGRSAANNDQLTLRHAAKDDLWLHAKDVPGSHVIIRQRPGQAFPRPVIEQAAALAAWYSKRKNDSLCPVIVTPKKHVRKPRGAAPGEVAVDREQQVLLVRPENPFERE